jgi:hypothetical protein
MYLYNRPMSGDPIPVGAGFSAPVQTWPVAHPASYTSGTGSFPGVKRPECGVDNPPHLAPWVKKEWSCTSTPHLGFRGLFYGEFHLSLTCLSKKAYSDNDVTVTALIVA